MPTTREAIIRALKNTAEAPIESLVFQNASREDPRTPDLDMLGEGGSGLVFRAAQTIGNSTVQRAVKFFVYREDIASVIANQTDRAAGAFAAEAENLANLRHDNVLRVIGGGTVHVDGNPVHYLISEYVEGQSLRDFLEELGAARPAPGQTAATADPTKESDARDPGEPRAIDMLELAIGIVVALEYMHGKSFVHCDVKPGNILLKVSESRVTPVLGDLGLSRCLDALPKDVLVLGTQRYMHPEMQNNQSVPAEYFRERAPAWDLHALKLTLSEMLEVPCVGADSNWFQAARASVEDAQYDTTRKLLDRLEFFHPSNHALGRVPELAGGMGSHDVKPIPLDHPVLSKRFRAVFHHRAMVRLNSVQQLLMKQTPFPGARHSRYEHALGVYENIRQYLIAMLDDRNSIKYLSPPTMELALLAGALCQVNRIPYAICFDDLRKQDKSIFKHTQALPLFDRALAEIKSHEGLSLGVVAARHFPSVSLDSVRRVLFPNDIGAEGASEEVFVSSLLNSSLDARVIDFVRRDSYHSGVFGGDPINFQELLAGLTIFENRLALKPFGIPTAESVICVRYWLFERLYWNRRTGSWVRRCADCSSNVRTTRFSSPGTREPYSPRTREKCCRRFITR